MPPRAAPKAYQILAKTHQVTIFLTVPQSATIALLKDEALSALTSRVAIEDENFPRVSSTSDFELAHAVKEKEKSKSGVTYEALEAEKAIRGLLSNWEILYFQFRDEDGNLMPVEVSQPSLVDDDEEEPPMNKGKRKALSE
ncbi:hypothetical protein DEU56DRAFT_766782 [Suillus clintonianus]|uniref:uncharacterized protein n=1 Tax=Suillus clintonianus TaxID=1904413 RepID=UPI001B87361E|nr:uncharacterized protein DEU56DRAFT_766782 [Suillus clintonianus]KAG2156375.1 hypothetical protein DEU56DRAFT_766782 [Suillus clintonianus]